MQLHFGGLLNGRLFNNTFPAHLRQLGQIHPLHLSPDAGGGSIPLVPLFNNTLTTHLRWLR